MAIVETVAATGKERRKIIVKNPATLEVIGEVKVSTRDEVVAAMARAREAQKLWAQKSIKERAKFLTRAGEAVDDAAHEFVALFLQQRHEAFMRIALV